MSNTGSEIDYGNWVARKFVILPFKLFLVFALLFGLSIMGVWPLVLTIVILIAALIFLAATIYFLYARHQFSPEGSGIQNRVLELLLSHIEWSGQGKVLDIGCGSGALVIKLAKKYTEAKLTGIDYWGGMWEYSKQKCQDNAQAEGVGGRIDFYQASAAELPFEQESFDLAVSNLVFHEVQDARDKRDVVKEALRVVKKGGVFAFQDLFLVKRLYGDSDDLLAEIKSWGIQEVHLIDTSQSDFIPGPLKLPFMIGNIAVMYGVK
ncbi:MAG TPA: class I SAM-dependent methyltransferase [Syntrophomonadaceae bacterium]|nr:class I SAM-dependent methyltransferase [Syntrophomonadaceae bacterium]